MTFLVIYSKFVTFSVYAQNYRFLLLFWKRFCIFPYFGKNVYTSPYFRSNYVLFPSFTCFFASIIFITKHLCLMFYTYWTPLQGWGNMG